MALLSLGFRLVLDGLGVGPWPGCILGFGLGTAGSGYSRFVKVLVTALDLLQTLHHLAALTPAPSMPRFALVAAYCVSPFGAAERAWKPFNPILGETFELEVGSGVRYLAEQVSHHPPICAAHAQNSHFRYDLVSAPTTRFLGNSLEVYPYGEDWGLGRHGVDRGRATSGRWQADVRDDHIANQPVDVPVSLSG